MANICRRERSARTSISTSDGARAFPLSPPDISSPDHSRAFQFKHHWKARSFFPALLILPLLLEIFPAAAAPQYPFEDPTLGTAARIDDFVNRLTSDEKISLLAGRDNWHLPAIDRLGVRGLVMTDGPAGLRSFESEPSTAFPVGIAAGATWDPALIQQEGRAIGEETLAHGVDVVLGPMVNIARVPNAGRNFEAFSEDPILTGALGTAYVQGVQSTGAGVAVKHFVANDQENGRNTGNSVVSERALREIYLAAFEPIVKTADPWFVMTAYPRVNGTFASENPFLMQDVLRGDWGFAGATVSDWTGTHSTVPALKAGLDLEMPGPSVWRGALLKEALARGEIGERDIDTSVRRIAALMLKAGIFDPDAKKTGSLNTPEHRAIAEKVAAESVVLLKNDRRVLPFNPSHIRTVAVIGADADRPSFQGGGSSQVIPDRVVSPLAALKALYGSKVRFLYAQGVDNEPRIPAADVRLLSPTRDRREEGLHAVYYNGTQFTGGVAFERTDVHFLKFGFGGAAGAVDWTKMPQGLDAVHNAIVKGEYTRDLFDAGADFSVKWTGYFFPPRDGTYEFSLVHDDSATLVLDGRVLIDDRSQTYPAPIFTFFSKLKERRSSLVLKAGRAYPIEIDFSATPTSSIGFDQKVFELGVRAPAGTIDEARAIARKADAAIVFVGAGSTAEAEGKDRDSIDLDSAQNALVERVAAANPRTVVVLNDGGALTMPWKARVPAIVEEWLPGQEGGSAIAKILFGDVDPSGRLPITFPARIEDNPAYLNYSGGNTQLYDEDIFVGYRYYDRRKIAPLFPFGHGLSYTDFAFGTLSAPDAVALGQNVPLTLAVTNAGNRAGAEVVQIYVQDDHAPVAEPVKALKAFARVELQPHETKTVRLSLSPRDLSYWDVETHSWIEDPGRFDVIAGVSSVDIRASTAFTLKAD
jgi:beta-glucosidase